MLANAKAMLKKEEEQLEKIRTRHRGAAPDDADAESDGGPKSGAGL